jgi:hypothetical protein
VWSRYQGTLAATAAAQAELAAAAGSKVARLRERRDQLEQEARTLLGLVVLEVQWAAEPPPPVQEGCVGSSSVHRS